MGESDVHLDRAFRVGLGAACDVCSVVVLQPRRVFLLIMGKLWDCCQFPGLPAGRKTGCDGFGGAGGSNMPLGWRLAKLGRSVLDWGVAGCVAGWAIPLGGFVGL
jgi:hypothetical protein